MDKALNTKDFAEAFGAAESEVLSFCGELIESLDFRYSVCTPEMRERIFLDVIRKCDNSELSASGPHRKDDWCRGWEASMHEFYSSGGDLKALIPKDWHGDRPLRYKGNYIIANSDSFEHDFSLVFRNWLYKKYFRDYKNIYEFGCGTGHNLAIMAKIFPNKHFFGMDWVPQSQEILSAVAEKYGWQIKGIQFDFFNPDYDLQILPNSLVYTSSALEQIGSDYGKYLDYLLAKRPEICINVECIEEYYDENKLYDYVALRYHRKRTYLHRFLTRLRELEKENYIKIIATKRTGFGSLYHEGYMYVIWKII